VAIIRGMTTVIMVFMILGTCNGVLAYAFGGLRVYYEKGRRKENRLQSSCHQNGRCPFEVFMVFMTTIVRNAAVQYLFTILSRFP
jgi:glutamyl-tRNA reductase